MNIDMMYVSFENGIESNEAHDMNTNVRNANCGGLINYGAVTNLHLVVHVVTAEMTRIWGQITCVSIYVSMTLKI